MKHELLKVPLISTQWPAGSSLLQQWVNGPVLCYAYGQGHQGQEHIVHSPDLHFDVPMVGLYSNYTDFYIILKKKALDLSLGGLVRTAHAKAKPGPRWPLLQPHIHRPRACACGLCYRIVNAVLVSPSPTPTPSPSLATFCSASPTFPQPHGPQAQHISF